MVEFGDIQLAAAIAGDYGEHFDDYLDHETYDRLSELFSTISERGYAAEYEQGDHNLKKAIKTLERQILNKREKGKSGKYKYAARRLAMGMLREAINGFDNRADRVLEAAGTALGVSPFKIGKRQDIVKPQKQLFEVSLDTSKAHSFIAKSINIGILPKTSGEDLRKIIFKQSALSAAQQAVSDILVDIYINKYRASDEVDDDDLMKASIAIKMLSDSIEQLNKLNGMLSEKMKQIAIIDNDINSSINFSQPLSFYFSSLFTRVERLIEEINHFVDSLNKGVLSSIYGQVSSLINLNLEKSKDIPKLITNNADKLLLKTQWPDRRIRFENNVEFDKNVFGDIGYYLNKVSININRALDTPFEKVKNIINSTSTGRNPSFDSSMSYGALNKINYSSSGQSPDVNVNSSRMITKRTTKDKDILNILYSVTDNLSLVFDQKELQDNDIETIREAVGEAIFNRPGLESEVTNYITNEVEASFNRAIS